MPVKRFFIKLNELTGISVYFYSDKKDVMRFVVKLNYFYLKKWREIARYDNYHGSVHRDLFNIYGDKIYVKRFPYLDNKSGLSFSIDDFKENHDNYIWIYKNG